MFVVQHYAAFHEDYAGGVGLGKLGFGVMGVRMGIRMGVGVVWGGARAGEYFASLFCTLLLVIGLIIVIGRMLHILLVMMC